MVCGEAEGKEAQVYVLWSKLFMEQNNQNFHKVKSAFLVSSVQRHISAFRTTELRTSHVLVSASFTFRTLFVLYIPHTHVGMTCDRWHNLSMVVMYGVKNAVQFSVAEVAGGNCLVCSVWFDFVRGMSKRFLKQMSFVVSTVRIIIKQNLFTSLRSFIDQAKEAAHVIVQIQYLFIL